MFDAMIIREHNLNETANNQSNVYSIPSQSPIGDISAYVTLLEITGNVNNAPWLYGICLAVVGLTLVGFLLYSLVALYLSEDKFSKAFNASPMMISIISQKNGRFIDVNASFCSSVGYDHNEILGHNAIELEIWNEDVLYLMTQQCLSGKDSFADLEINYTRKNGEQRLASYSAVGIDINGEECTLIIMLDISEQKQLEVEMYRLERLGVVGEMAAGIGHEIRNPMTTVRGFLQIMQNKKEYSKDKDTFDLMIEELDRANAIITEFLSLAKDKIVKLEPVNLKVTLTNILPLVTASAMIKNHTIKLDMDDLPDLLLDEKEIRQLIFNLVNNGLEAMPTDGILTIKTFVDNKDVVLSIQDQGHGIDPEILEKVGTPFFTTKDNGTGLGLAVCYNIATRHHAIINIDTGSKGTTFLIRFPIGNLQTLN